MENSNKPSSSSVVQDVEKKSLANKSTKKMSSSSMKAAKMPVKMQKSKKQVALSKKSNPLKKKGAGKVFKKSLAKNTKKGPFKAKSAKKQAATLKKSTSSSEGLLKTRAASNRASLDSLMAGFEDEAGVRAKTAMGMPLKDFSKSAVALLLSNYKVENEKVLSATALAM